MEDRIKLLRDTLQLNQEIFGQKLGVTTSTVSGWESGRRSPSQAIIKSICKTYNVNYLWLTEGEGDMFMGVPETIIDELVVQYDLNETETDILKNYLTLTKEQRQAVQDYLRKIFNLKWNSLW